VDDTTIISVSTDPNDLSLQHAAFSLSVWSSLDGMAVNENKKMRVYFGRNYDSNCISTVCYNDKHILSVFRLLNCWVFI
jgi:hypothetical protein